MKLGTTMTWSMKSCLIKAMGFSFGINRELKIILNKPKGHVFITCFLEPKYDPRTIKTTNASCVFVQMLRHEDTPNPIPEAKNENPFQFQLWEGLEGGTQSDWNIVSQLRHPRSLTASLPLKNDGWKTIRLPFGSRYLFRGELLNFGGVY